VLEGEEWRRLLDAIPTDSIRDLRDRALIATLTYSFARIGAALKMKVNNLRPRGAGWTIRLHEKGGKHHPMPCHHALAEALHAYIAAAGIAEDRKGWLFRTFPRARRHHTFRAAQGPAGRLAYDPPARCNSWNNRRNRLSLVPATGITAYLSNGGALEHTQEMAAHESPRTTKLYDRTKDRLTQDEVERIRL
jgi:integrase